MENIQDSREQREEIPEDEVVQNQLPDPETVLAAEGGESKVQPDTTTTNTSADFNNTSHERLEKFYGSCSNTIPAVSTTCLDESSHRTVPLKEQVCGNSEDENSDRNVNRINASDEACDIKRLDSQLNQLETEACTTRDDYILKGLEHSNSVMVEANMQANNPNPRLGALNNSENLDTNSSVMNLDNLNNSSSLSEITEIKTESILSNTNSIISNASAVEVSNVALSNPSFGASNSLLETTGASNFETTNLDIQANSERGRIILNRAQAVLERAQATLEGLQRVQASLEGTQATFGGSQATFGGLQATFEGTQATNVGEQGTQTIPTGPQDPLPEEPAVEGAPEGRRPSRRGQRVQVRVQATSPMMFLREQLFLALFQRMAGLYASSVSRPLQRVIEFVLLSQALLSFAALVYVHTVFVREPVSCLQVVQSEWSRLETTGGGIVRVEILRDVPVNYSLTDSYEREKGRRGLLSRRLHSRMVEEEDYKHKDEKPALVKFDEYDNISVETNLTELEYGNKSDEYVKIEEEEENDWFQLTLNLLASHLLGISKYEFNMEDLNIYEYANELGFLHLSSSTRKKLNITVLHIVLDPDKEKCMGRPFAKFLLQEFLGFEDVVLSSFQLLTPKGQRLMYASAYISSKIFLVDMLGETCLLSGYASSVDTGVNYKFVDGEEIDSRRAYLSAFSLMILFTLSVSMLLRCSHHQIFIFIVEVLQLLNRMTMITFPLATLIIAVCALVGIETLMSRVFVEESTAFFVILTVWLADQYDVICCTTNISRRYFLRFFYLYHYLFYAYHCRFQGQFSWMAMVCSWLFIQHAMVYFFHHYELPPIVRQAELRRIIAHHQQQQRGGTGQAGQTPTTLIASPDPSIFVQTNPGMGGAVNLRPRRTGLLGRWTLSRNRSENSASNQPSEVGNGGENQQPTSGADNSGASVEVGRIRVDVTLQRAGGQAGEGEAVGWFQFPRGYSITSYVVRDGNIEVMGSNQHIAVRRARDNQVELSSNTDNVNADSSAPLDLTSNDSSTLAFTSDDLGAYSSSDEALNQDDGSLGAEHSDVYHIEEASTEEIPSDDLSSTLR